MGVVDRRHLVKSPNERLREFWPLTCVVNFMKSFFVPYLLLIGVLLPPYVSSAQLSPELKEALQTQLGEFCDYNAQEDLKLFGLTGKELRRSDSDWLLSTHPDAGVRAQAQGLNLNSQLSQIERPAPNYVGIRDRLRLPSQPPDAYSMGLNSSLNRMAACALTDWKNAPSCAKALDRLSQIMQVSSNGLALLDLFVELASTEKYYRPLIEASKRIVRKTLQIDTKGGFDSSGNIMNELLQHFSTAGLSDAESSDLAWKVLGAFGVAGSNITLRTKLIERENPGVAGALGIIGQSIPTLDARAKQHGRRYALPEGFTAKCDQGKSYHFWMSAYLTRQLIREGFTSDTASAAVFTAHKAYQMLSTTAGRNPALIFAVHEFDPVVNTMRMDFAYSAAGIAYGKQRPQMKIQKDIDRTIVEMFNRAGRSPQLTYIDAAAYTHTPSLSMYRAFSSILTPDYAYQSLVTGTSTRP